MSTEDHANDPLVDPAAIEQYCINATKLLDNLIRWDPTFYSDWTLSQCRLLVDADPARCPLIRPEAFPTLYAGRVTAVAALLNPCDGNYLSGRIIAEALRLIIEAIPPQSNFFRLRYLTRRLYPTDVPVIQLMRNHGSANPIAAFTTLCIRLGKKLLEHPAIVDAPYVEFRRQLADLADSTLPTTFHDSYKLPPILPGQGPIIQTESYEAIQLAYMYLETDASPDPVATIQNAIASLSELVTPSPAFPDLSECLKRYFANTHTASGSAPATAPARNRPAITRRWADHSPTPIVQSVVDHFSGKTIDLATRPTGREFLSAPFDIRDAMQEELRRMCSIKSDAIGNAADTKTYDVMEAFALVEQSATPSAKAQPTPYQGKVARPTPVAATTAESAGRTTTHGSPAPQQTSPAAATPPRPAAPTVTPHATASTTPTDSASDAAIKARTGSVPKPQSQGTTHPAGSADVKEERRTVKVRIRRNIPWPEEGTQ